MASKPSDQTQKGGTRWKCRTEIAWWDTSADTRMRLLPRSLVILDGVAMSLVSEHPNFEEPMITRVFGLDLESNSQ